VFSQDEMAEAKAALDELHKDNHKFVSMMRDPQLALLMYDPRLEQIAKFMLEAEDVVHSGNTSLYKHPDPQAEAWQPVSEHVDVQYSLEEFDARPKNMMCMLMILVSDLPEGRGNTFVRPGSHRMLAQHLADNGQEPYRARPVFIKDLPELDWPEPQPIVGKRGTVVAFSTSLVHGGSANITDEPRQLVFSNFCARGKLKQVSGNHDRWEGRDEYRNYLRTLFPQDRQHLLEDSYG
jgi:ectoine hydroxylase-related dioxygenase (phytanoyl-CoA dioxygenase family)